MFTLERLFAIFWLLYCVLVPIFVRLYEPARALAERINLPIVPLTVGLFFPISHIVSKLIELVLVDELAVLHWPMIEIKETTTGILFLVVAIYFLQAARKKTEAAQSAAAS